MDKSQLPLEDLQRISRKDAETQRGEEEEITQRLTEKAQRAQRRYGLAFGKLGRGRREDLRFAQVRIGSKLAQQ